MKEKDILIQKAKENDQDAQLKLYNKYAEAMYNTAKRIMKDELAAEDIVQESFIQAFQKINQFQEEITFGSWLKRLVINNAISSYKNSKGNYLKFENSKEAKKESLNDIQIDKVVSAIKTVPKKYQNVLALYLIEGYDFNEISEILEIPNKTLRSQYKKALDLLRHRLSNDSKSEIYSKNVCEIFIDPGHSSVDEIKELFESLSELNKSLGGNGLIFSNSNKSVILELA